VKAAKEGFALVEILIVVVILGILAVMVIPQFSNASTEAKQSRVCSDLQVMRLAIELYKVQHNDTLPGTVDGVSFAEALTEKTDESGALDSTGPYGPYIPKIPVNPYNNLATVEVEAGSANLGGGNCGWHFDSSTGQIHADTDGHTSW